MALDPTSEKLLAKIKVVLHRTRTAENVGGTARAMANMGLAVLVLAEPANWDRAKAARIATEAGAPLRSAAFTDSLDATLDETTLFVATSAYPREDLPSLTPETTAKLLLGEAARGGDPALVFGDEQSGLPRRVLDRAYGISTIDTDDKAPSLNLAQSVLVHAYALRREASSSVPRVTSETDEPAMSPTDLSRLRETARALLLEAGYLNRQQPDKIMWELERMLLKRAPTQREGKLLLAMVRQLEWRVAGTPAPR